MVPVLLVAITGSPGCSSKRSREQQPAQAPPLIDRMATVPAGWFSLGCYRLLASSEADDATFESPFYDSFDDERIVA